VTSDNCSILIKVPNKDGICTYPNCEGPPADGGACEPFCTLDIDGLCKDACSDSVHYEIINGACEQRPECEHHVIGGVQIWKCGPNPCPPGESDFDGDTICAPVDCYERTPSISGGWVCGKDGEQDMCVLDTDGQCKQSCTNKFFYRPNEKGECRIVPCGQRYSNGEQVFPCGEGCYMNIVNSECVEECQVGFNDGDNDGVCAAINCTQREPDDKLNGSCGVGCVRDYDGRCKQSCSNKDHYLRVRNVCELKDCEDRTPASQGGTTVCGENCQLDPNTNKCVYHASESVQKSSKSGVPWWVWVIVGVVVVAAVVALLGYLIYYKLKVKQEKQEKANIEELMNKDGKDGNKANEPNRKQYEKNGEMSFASFSEMTVDESIISSSSNKSGKKKDKKGKNKKSNNNKNSKTEDVKSSDNKSSKSKKSTKTNKSSKSRRSSKSSKSRKSSKSNESSKSNKSGKTKLLSSSSRKSKSPSKNSSKKSSKGFGNSSGSSKKSGSSASKAKSGNSSQV
jgi:uncharacterized membrane protein YgcG